jgi:putative salt-induced outer membrane protein YdiY
MRTCLIWIGTILIFVAVADADEVVLSNGDKLTGKVGQIVGGKMTFTSPVLGEMTIDMANVQSFTTDEPAEIRLKKGPPVEEKIKTATTQEITTESGKTVPYSDIRLVNPPPEKWTGFVLGNLSIVRGNTETIDAGVSAQAILRRQQEHHNDRFTLSGEYNFANTGTGDSSVTTEENVKALAKYDRFFTEKWYGYALVGYEKDHLADLEYRFTPGVGFGYQFYATPTFNLSGEAGLSYVFERFDPGGNNDFVAARFAYHVDKKLRDNVSVFHNLEYLPSLEDFADDYLINADAGIQVDITKSFFTQAKVEWNYDATPATGRKNNDYRYLVGVGWRF